jgi:peptidoglycan glycosyltransferase
VERGSIFDRNNQAITATLGSVGNFSYNLQYPALSNTIGYFDYAFGMSNLEEKYNDYLSGERGYSTPELWFNYLLYNQPLPGRDIRLTLDLATQSCLDYAIRAESQGAALVMNAQTGEILAISSSPAYNANTLARNFTTWKSDATSPLLNRASQGSYPLGELLTPFLISENEALLQTDYSETAGATSPACAIGDQQPQFWSEAVASGCRAALRLAANGQNGPYITSLVSKYGLTAVFNLGLPENPVQKLDEESSWQNLVLGQNRIRVSPLQVAYAFSIFSNQGRQSSPQSGAAVIGQKEGWLEREKASSTQVITVETRKIFHGCWPRRKYPVGN